MRRSWYLFGVVFLAAALVAWWLWPRRRGKVSVGGQASEGPQEEVRYTARREEDREHPAPRPLVQSRARPDAGVVVKHVFVPGKGPMILVEDPNAVPPPPKDRLPEAREKPEIPPELPQTPDWKLKMTRRLVGTMKKSIARLEQRIQHAKRSGAAPEEVHRMEILLQRRRMRLGRLEADVRVLQEQVAAQQQARPGPQARQAQARQAPESGGGPGTEPPAPGSQEPPGP